MDGRALPEARLTSLYDAPEFGGETTMRAMVTRELIDEGRRPACAQHALAEDQLKDLAFGVRPATGLSTTKSWRN